MTEKFIRSILKNYLFVLALLFALSIGAAYSAAKLKFDSSIEIWFLDDDPNLVFYKNFQKYFTGDEIIVAAVFADDVFSPKALSLIDKLSKEFEKASYVHKVRSLTHTEYMGGEGDTISFEPLIQKIPKNKVESEIIRKKAVGSSLMKNFYSKDFKASAIVIEMSHDGNSVDGKIKLVSQLREIIKKRAGPFDVRLSGSPVFDDAFFRYSEDDFKSIAPFTVVFMVIAVFWLFRRFSTAVIPLAVVALSNLFTFAIMSMLGLKINIISTTITVVILGVGVADTIHVIADFYQQLIAGKNKEEAIVSSFKHLFIPCLFTTITTAIGMLSLLVGDLKPMREFGVLAAIGVFFAFFLSITLVPILLKIITPPPKKFMEKLEKGKISNFISWLGQINPLRSKKILAFSLLIFALSLWQMTNLYVGSNPMEYFKESDPLRSDTLKIEKAVGGSVGIEFFVKAPNSGLKNPDNLKKLQEFENLIEKNETITDVISVMDQLKEMNKIFNNHDPNFKVLPDTKDKIAQFYLLLEGSEDFDQFIPDDFVTSRLSARISFSESHKIYQKMDDYEKHIKENYDGEDLSIVATGFVKLMVDMENYLLSSQIRSLLLALVLITLMMFFLLKDLKLALFSMIPNFIPIFLGIAFMATFDINLDPGTVMISSLAIGLVVDDSVHFLVRLQNNLKSGKNLSESIDKTMSDTARPIIITTVVLSAAFAILGLSNFTPNIYFGIVSSVVILFALLADLILLPALLTILQPTLKK